MSVSPLISIVTPSFNQAAYLEQTIQSVLKQDIQSLEYIIIDGGSTDGSQEIIQKYEKHLAYWVSEPDRGQAEAINKGMEQTHGGILAWLNSDDYYMPDSLAKVLSAFAQKPELGMIYGDVLSVDTDSIPINVMRYGDWGLEELMHFRIIGQAGVFFRRAAMEIAGGLDTNYHYLLDHQYWLKIAQSMPIQYLPGVLAAARFHPGAKNISQPAGFGQEAYAIVDWMKSQTGLSRNFTKNRRKIYAGAHWINARYLSESEQVKKALLSYARSFINHPAPVVRDWRRVLYTLALSLGIKKIRFLGLKMRDKRRQNRMAANQIDMYQDPHENT